MNKDEIIQKWHEELAEFKRKLYFNARVAMDAFIAHYESDHDEEFWNDEFGMDAKDAFKDYIGWLYDWADNANGVVIDTIMS